MLGEVLQCFSVYDQAVGYVQGINLIAANLLYHIKSAPETFWALVELMETQELRLIYVGEMEQLAIHCANIDRLFQQEFASLYGLMS